MAEEREKQLRLSRIREKRFRTTQHYCSLKSPLPTTLHLAASNVSLVYLTFDFSVICFLLSSRSPLKPRHERLRLRSESIVPNTFAHACAISHICVRVQH